MIYNTIKIEMPALKSIKLEIHFRESETIQLQAS